MEKKEVKLMDKPKGLILIERVKNGEEVTCPLCGEGHIVAKGDPETSRYFYCDNKKCGKGICLD